MREKELEKLKDYKYGFSTDIENIKAPKGLNEDVIKFISNIKKEPEWMLDFRLKALSLQSSNHFGSFLMFEINFITFSLRPLGALILSISVEKPYLYSFNFSNSFSLIEFSFG